MIGTISPARRWRDQIFKFVCGACAAFAGALLLVLIYGVAKDGVGGLSLDFLTHFTSRRPKNAGILAPIVGSLSLVVLTMVIAVPVGVAAAIYLEEIAPKGRLRSLIQTNIANLSGVPSIIYGILGLALFVRAMALDTSIVAGALTLALLILPTVIITTQEALKAVPKSYREGALALGATPWQTIRTQVVPSAIPMIMTGIILSVCRTIGETAPLVVVGAAAFVMNLPSDLGSKYTVLPMQIYVWASDPKIEFQRLASSAIIVLVAILVMLNLAAIVIRNRYSKHRS